MLDLYYRQGGTLNFRWLKVIEPTADKAADIRRMGYPTVWAAEAPTTFVAGESLEDWCERNGRAPIDAEFTAG